MPIDPITGMAISQGVSTLGNIYGSQQAAKAQQDAAKRQAELARRNMLLQIQLQEPQRNVGYQALGDLAGVRGYAMPGYTSPNALMQSQTPLKSKAIKAGLGAGLSVDQLAQGGTLGQLTARNLRRLAKAGLSGDDILRLQGMGGATQPTQGSVPGAAGGQDFSKFRDSPDYQFRLSEGIKGLEQSAAARGGALSGNALRGITDYGQNTAANEYGNWWNRTAQLAGLGTAATNNVGNAATGTTGALMGSAQQQGDARASGILGTTNALTGGLNSGWNNWLGWQYVKGQNGQPPQSSPYGPWAGGYQFPRGG